MKAAMVRLRLLWLRMVNRFGNSQMLEAAGPVVSLTSYGKRCRTVYLVIESIAGGSVLPSRCILWLDDRSVFDNLPKALRRLQSRGLEIRLCTNYGPHTKYYPYLESVTHFKLPLVTADDDILYPKLWLESLAQAYRSFPSAVNCHRARVIEMADDGIGKYETWLHADSTRESSSHFALGIGGVIYPPRLQEHLKNQGRAFLHCCAKADDVWLHVQALRAGFKIRQLAPGLFPLVYIPGSQGNALYHDNVMGGENDKQIKLAYGSEEIKSLQERQNEFANSPQQGPETIGLRNQLTI